jgi:hypothetical protein
MAGKRGRPFLYKKKLTVVTLGLPAEDLQKLKELADGRLAQNQLRHYTDEVREAVRQYLGRSS